jgi:hypothetical protein
MAGEVHLSRALPARYVPLSGFGDPLGGFRPPAPRRFCFAPTALWGFTLRSFPLQRGIRGVSAGMDPPAVCPSLFPTAHAEVGRPGVGFWALTRAGVPGTATRYERNAGWRLPWVLLCACALPFVRAQPPPGYAFAFHRAVHYCRRAGGLWRPVGALP